MRAQPHISLNKSLPSPISGSWQLAQDCLIRLRDWKPALLLGLAHNQPSGDVLELLKTQLILAREVDAFWGFGGI